MLRTRVRALVPQRGSVPQPRVVALPLPWVLRRAHLQPHRGCVNRSEARRVVTYAIRTQLDATPLG